MKKIKALTELKGFSVCKVFLVLTGEQLGIRIQTAEFIQQAAAEYNYYPNRIDSPVEDSILKVRSP